jgi:geranylgeranyl pyrophosphate synthase
MRRALIPDDGKSAHTGEESSRWALLPGLCCQAAGGDPQWADNVAAAWFLYYVAADLMDTVEDRDEPDAWWAEIGPGFALNVASGLFFSASQVLNHLYNRPETQSAASAIAASFNHSFLTMCSGQHADLIQPEPTLERYWETVAEKSGTFFALACEAGAHLATVDEEKLKRFAEFGQNLGIIVQILDDLEEFRTPGNTDGLPELSGLGRSLPVVYALEVYPLETRIRLRDCLRESRHDPQAARQAWDLIDGSGAGSYMLVELERHRSMALAELHSAQPLAPAGERLASLIPKFDLKG